LICDSHRENPNIISLKYLFIRLILIYFLNQYFFESALPLTDIDHDESSVDMAYCNKQPPYNNLSPRED
jgi:hypothetical protein